MDLSRALISMVPAFRPLGLTTTRTGTPRRSASENMKPALTGRSSQMTSMPSASSAFTSA